MLSRLVFALFLTQAGLMAGLPETVDIVRAKRVFDGNCAGCHGPEGSGGKGPSLAVPKLRYARTSAELTEIISGGIPGTEMPPSWYLGSAALKLVVSYVQTLGANAKLPRPEGDVAKGKELFHGKGACTKCHTIGAEGHAYGPDLSDIGARRNAASLRDSVVEPNSKLPEGFVTVRAITSQKEVVSGIRVNQDDFTIQLLEPSGHFRSFRTDGLLELKEESAESPMPSYRAAFSESELRDLVGYLSSLRGEQ